jgi:hypothetical protein
MGRLGMGLFEVGMVFEGFCLDGFFGIWILFTGLDLLDFL